MLIVHCRGREDGVEIRTDHKIPLHKGGTNTVDNGQTLCSEHNFLKKNYSQTEFGKRFFVKLYSDTIKKDDKKWLNSVKKFLTSMKNIESIAT